jgi:hypothetical protein
VREGGGRERGSCELPVCAAGSGGEGEVLRSVERKHFLGVVILGEDADHSL